MEIRNFDDFQITTMTLVITLSGGVNTDAAFLLLPTTKINSENAKISSKSKLPHCLTPGSIISMRYKGNFRGIIRRIIKNISTFKNAVTIDISTKIKNISLKLCSNSIQMCGASSVKDGIEAATHLINHLTKIQSIIDKISENKELSLEMINWIKINCQGEIILRSSWNTKKFKNIDMRIYNEIKDNKIIIPNKPIPEHFDKDILDFLISFQEECYYHSYYVSMLDLIMRIDKIIDTDLCIKQVDEAMVNYNYSLGFQVDRFLLNKYIDGINGFSSRYDNALSTSVTVELPYEPPEGLAIKRRKNKIPRISFLIYRSGSVTLSSPGTSAAKPAYYLFMNTILTLRNIIEYVPSSQYNN